MGTISLAGLQPADGETIDAADVNNQTNAIVDEFNGGIDNNNIDASAAIAQSKLATTTLGYAEITSDFTTATIGSTVDITGLAATVTVPAGGRRVKITAFASGYYFQGAGGVTCYLAIAEGATTLTSAMYVTPGSGFTESVTAISVTVPTAGSHTYKAMLQTSSGSGNSTIKSSATNPSFILVELI